MLKSSLRVEILELNATVYICPWTVSQWSSYNLCARRRNMWSKPLPQIADCRLPKEGKRSRTGTRTVWPIVWITFYPTFCIQHYPTEESLSAIDIRIRSCGEKSIAHAIPWSQVISLLVVSCQASRGFHTCEIIHNAISAVILSQLIDHGGTARTFYLCSESALQCMSIAPELGREPETNNCESNILAITLIG